MYCFGFVFIFHANRIDVVVVVKVPGVVIQILGHESEPVAHRERERSKKTHRQEHDTSKSLAFYLIVKRFLRFLCANTSIVRRKGN